MDIQALATENGLDILKNEVFDRVKRFVLLGASTKDDEMLAALIQDRKTTYESIHAYKIFEEAIDIAYYDDLGQLTFELPLPYEPDFNRYIHGIGLLGTGDQDEIILVSITPTPKIMKFSGVGGTFTYKINVSGEADTLVYDNKNAVSPAYFETRLKAMRLYADEMFDRHVKATYIRDLGVIGANERIELANEFGTNAVHAIVEVQYNGKWGATGIWNDSGVGWFATAHQYDVTGDRIIVRTGSGGVLALPQYAGHPHTNTANQTSLPARLRVVYLAEGDPIHMALPLHDYTIADNFRFDACFYAPSIDKYVASSSLGLIAHTEDPAAVNPWYILVKPGMLELTYGNGVFIADMGATLEYSTDLVTWTACTLPEALNERNITACGYYEKGDFFAVWDAGNDDYLMSADGITFTVQTALTVSSHPNRIMSAGEYLFIFNTEGAEPLASNDGLTFTAVTVELDNIYDVTFGNSIYMITGSRADGACVAISTDDGLTYTVQNGINIPHIAMPDIVCQFGKGQFVIADYINIRYYKSVDGITWGGHTYA